MEDASKVSGEFMFMPENEMRRRIVAVVRVEGRFQEHGARRDQRGGHVVSRAIRLNIRSPAVGKQRPSFCVTACYLLRKIRSGRLE